MEGSSGALYDIAPFLLLMSQQTLTVQPKVLLCLFLCVTEAQRHLQDKETIWRRKLSGKLLFQGLRWASRAACDVWQQRLPPLTASPLLVFPLVFLGHIPQSLNYASTFAPQRVIKRHDEWKSYLGLAICGKNKQVISMVIARSQLKANKCCVGGKSTSSFLGGKCSFWCWLMEHSTLWSN